jgi:FecR protein
MRNSEQSPRYARLAAGVLARGVDDDATATASALPDRAATVAAIEGALRARGRRRLAPWLASGVAAAAAAVLLFAWHGSRAPGSAEPSGVDRAAAPRVPGLVVAAVDGAGASIETAGSVRAAVAGDRITAGVRVRVLGDGQLSLAIDTGTRLRFAGPSRARVTELGTLQRFDLENGALEANVAKLSAGGRFVIATGDAEVEVKGTRFEVAVVPEPSACAPFVQTRVTVREGVVAVRAGGSEVRVAAGSVWPACDPPVSPARISRTRTARPPATPAASAALPPQVDDSSTLAAQNDLLAAALAARRRGDVREAIQWLDRLITRYPDGPLIGSARAERQRLIDEGGRKAPAE